LDESQLSVGSASASASVVGESGVLGLGICDSATPACAAAIACLCLYAGLRGAGAADVPPPSGERMRRSLNLVVISGRESWLIAGTIATCDAKTALVRAFTPPATRAAHIRPFALLTIAT
jgi:hypothetical protein